MDPLHCCPIKENVKKRRKKIHLNYFPKADFFSFSFFTETRNSQMQVKKQKIFYRIKKSSVVGFGYDRDPEHWARVDNLAFGGCMERNSARAHSPQRARRPVSVEPAKACKERSLKRFWNAPLS